MPKTEKASPMPCDTFLQRCENRRFRANILYHFCK
nr:MAG TPA: hypothetical protein [Caudoviricetes sp.]